MYLGLSFGFGDLKKNNFYAYFKKCLGFICKTGSVAHKKGIGREAILLYCRIINTLNNMSMRPNWSRQWMHKLL